ncbi:MAG: hypothetical protein ACLRL6_10895 [Clostridium sp.]
MTQKTMSVLLATAFLVGVGYKAMRHVFQKQIIGIRIHRESMKSRRNHLRFFIYLCDMKIAVNINSCRCHSITV